MGDDNLSEDFKEILQKSNLNDKAKDAIKIISGGGTPSGKQVARPDLMNIIRFFMGTYKCTNDEDKIESIDLTSNTEEEENENSGSEPNQQSVTPSTDSSSEGDFS